MDFLPLLQATPAPAANPFLSLLPMVAIFAIMYFLILRPQQTREKRRRALIAEVKKGDRIVTIGGLHATVAQVDEQTILAQVDSSVKIRLEKSAIASRLDA